MLRNADFICGAVPGVPTDPQFLSAFSRVKFLSGNGLITVTLSGPNGVEIFSRRRGPFIDLGRVYTGIAVSSSVANDVVRIGCGDSFYFEDGTEQGPGTGGISAQVEGMDPDGGPANSNPIVIAGIDAGGDLHRISVEEFTPGVQGLHVRDDAADALLNLINITTFNTYNFLLQESAGVQLAGTVSAVGVVAGSTVDQGVTGWKPKCYALQVIQAGGVTGWVVQLQVSLDMINWTTVLTHATADGTNVVFPADAIPRLARGLRLNVAAYVPGPGSNITIHGFAVR